MSGADLRRVDALSQMRNALLRFRDATGAIPAQVRVRVERTHAQLQRKQGLLKTNIESLREQLTHCDDDERSEVRRAIADALNALDILRDRRRNLTAAIARHDRAAASWQRAIGNTLPAAAAFLAQKHAEAVAYQTLTAPGFAASSGQLLQFPTIATLDDAVAGIAQARAVEPSDPIRATSPDALPSLPAGFNWVPIDWVDPLDLPTQADFRKVTYAEMREGLQRMWREIIPMLMSSPKATRATFEEFDEAQGRRIDRMGFVHPSSLAHLWDQLLDRRWGHHIRIQCNERTGQWSIDNGRHRVKAALDLGWRYVPAELIRVHPQD
jgi:hypothetical protein